MRSALTAAAMLLALLPAAPATADSGCAVSLPEPLSGRAAVEALGPSLPRAAAEAGLGTAQLRRNLTSDSTLWVDICARPFYIEPAATQRERMFEPALDPGGDVLKLHSSPGSDRVIHLDVDGIDSVGTGWVRSYGQFSAPGYSMDDDPAFTATERARIADIWQRVAEDYAPFDVDVTTEDPGAEAIGRADASDQEYGTRVAIVGANPIYAACKCGGIAYVNVFDDAEDHAYYQPAFAFVQGLGTGSKNIAEAASHEAGHNLGLSHDGVVGGAAYYRGQGVWAPIMGVGYYRPLSQWSKGEYANANRTQDDLAIIADSGTPKTIDDVGNSRATATSIGPGTLDAVIGTAGDTDWFEFSASDLTTVTVDPQAVSPDLDARLDLYNKDGTLLASDDPTPAQVSTDIVSGMGATITQVLPAGTYYAAVDGVGTGDAMDTGYTDYASLGRYELTLTTSGVPALVVTRQVLASATVDAAYSTTFAATGGSAPYTFAVVLGVLPSGLALSPDGTLTGTPAIAGTYSFTVEATDALSTTARGTFTLSVKAKPVTPAVPPPAQPSVSPPPVTPSPTPTPTVTVPPAVIITTERALPRARVGKRYATRLRGTNAISWHATGTPRGLRLNADGKLSGRPKKAGKFQFTVVATGSSGQTDTGMFTIRVRRAAR